MAYQRVAFDVKTLVERSTSGRCLDYLALQRFIYRIAEAVRCVLAPERVYILSLGSHAANSHVHWHVAPLPVGVPLEQQQYHALMHEHGVVATAASDVDSYVRDVRAALR